MKYTLHHVEISHTSSSISGGEKALIETVRYFSKIKDYTQIIYTSESGMEVYKKLLDTDGANLEYVVIGQKSVERIHEYIAYYARVFQCLFCVRNFNTDSQNIIFTHEEFLPSALYSWLLKRKNSEAKWIGFYHMKSPSIFKGFEGEYINKFKFPSIRVMRYKLEQFIFYKLTQNKIDAILTVNQVYDTFLKQKYNRFSKKGQSKNIIHVIKRYSGIEALFKNDSTQKEFDLCFMARFHAQKGLLEVVDILKRVKQLRPEITLALMGGGSKRIESIFFDLVKKENLSDNIKYFGFVVSDKKYEILQKSRIFLFPSYYESFGQSALEAMKYGLPVVAYDLPPFGVFEKGMIKVPILDNQKMAQEIVSLLDDEEYYFAVRKDASEFSSEFSWDKTAEEIKILLESL